MIKTLSLISMSAVLRVPTPGSCANQHLASQLAAFALQVPRADAAVGDAQLNQGRASVYGS